MKASYGQPYSVEEDALIRAMATAGHDDQDIADKLGRPHGSVESRRRKLRIIRPPQHVPFTDEQGAIVATMFAAGASDAEIGAAIGRTTDAVGTYRRRALGLRRPTVAQPASAKVAPAPAPEPVNDERPYGVPFETRSGLRAIRLASGVVPFIPSVYGDGGPGPHPG